MRRLLIAPLLAALLASAAPAATAGPADESAAEWKCDVRLAGIPGSESQQAVIHGRALVFDYGDPRTPVGATLRCDLYVNDVLQGSTPAVHGTTVLATAGVVAATVREGDEVHACPVVEFDHGKVMDLCDWGTLPVFPPAWTTYLLQRLLDTTADDVNEVLVAFDPTVCPVLAAAGPGVPGVLEIDPTGDGYVAGELVWDCPPYTG